MTEIIVLGAGIGGISMAYELRALVGRKANITLLSDSEWFHFVPSNPWVASIGGSRKTSRSTSPRSAKN